MRRYLYVWNTERREWHFMWSTPIDTLTECHNVFEEGHPGGYCFALVRREAGVEC